VLLAPSIRTTQERSCCKTPRSTQHTPKTRCSSYVVEPRRMDDMIGYATVCSQSLPPAHLRLFPFPNSFSLHPAIRILHLQRCSCCLAVGIAVAASMRIATLLVCWCLSIRVRSPHSCSVVHSAAELLVCSNSRMWAAALLYVQTSRSSTVPWTCSIQRQTAYTHTQWCDHSSRVLTGERKTEEERKGARRQARC